MKILLVEDSNTLRFMMIKMLKELGYKDLLAVGTAEEALPIMSNQKVDLVFLDWNLPRMSGYDLLRQVRATPALAALNIIMVTTMHERKNILQALKVGVQGYMLKPVTKPALLEKIKEIESKLVA